MARRVDSVNFSFAGGEHEKHQRPEEGYAAGDVEGRGKSSRLVDNGAALVTNATAPDRCSGGTQRPIMLMQAGNTAASPIPRPIRASTRADSDTSAAGGVSAVNSDHHTTATPNTIFPPNRLASALLTSISSR